MKSCSLICVNQHWILAQKLCFHRTKFCLEEALRLLQIGVVSLLNKGALNMCRKDGVFESGFSAYLAHQIAAAPDSAARWSSKCCCFHFRARVLSKTHTDHSLPIVPGCLSAKLCSPEALSKSCRLSLTRFVLQGSIAEAASTAVEPSPEAAGAV